MINQSGIIFGGTSQINVHTLIASTLDLSSKLSANNYQGFVQSGLFSQLSDRADGAAGVTGPGAAVFNQGAKGKVTVQPGAIIDTTGKVTLDWRRRLCGAARRRRRQQCRQHHHPERTDHPSPRIVRSIW